MFNMTTDPTELTVMSLMTQFLAKNNSTVNPVAGTFNSAQCTITWRT
jgi:hypothetical protein